MNRNSVILILITVPDQEISDKIAGSLLQQNLAACINAVPNLTSHYRWKGELHRDSEILLLIKSTDEKFDKLCEQVRKIHPYELPEIIAIDVQSGLSDYLAWVKDECLPDS